MGAAAPRSYDGVWKTLHWLVAGLVGVQYVTKLASPGVFAGVSENGLNAWHLAVGPTILLLMALRLVWRLTHTPPPPPNDLAPALRALSRATHWAMYVILLVLPVLGWVAASGYGARPFLFGLVPLPFIAARSRSLGETVGAAHGVLAWVLLAVIGLHVCGAMYHALAREDGVFARMMPFGRPGAP